MKSKLHRCVLLLALLALPAAAWGPRTQTAIVSTGAQLLAKSNTVGLDRTMKDLVQGAGMSMDQLRGIYPDLDLNPINCVEQEMQLLNSVRGDRIDAYFSYRLGALGKIIAELCAPLQSTTPTYRNLYFSDVDKIISTLSLKPGDRTTVEPQTYFGRVMTEAAVNDAVIQREYESGAGFSEVARSTVGKDASRAVNAVADVLYTILTGRASTGAVSEAQRQRYVISAYDFYISRANDVEISAAVDRLDKIVTKTPAMREQIGDMFQAAGMDERAMAEYGVVVSEAPERREVAGKMASYYVEEGQKALSDEKYEDAIENFQKALDADPLHTDAERFRRQAEQGMNDRDKRLTDNKASLQRAAEQFALAEEEATRKHFAEAIELLRQATDSYAEAGSEFPEVAQERMRGEERTKNRMREYKQQLTTNASAFSGSGYGPDVRQMAANNGAALDERTLKSLVEHEYKAQLERLESGITADLGPK